jgi:hypothetical protein
MSIKTKEQLQIENQASFPDNTTGLITPEVLRNFNSDVIDTLVDSNATASFATTGSNDFTGLQTIYIDGINDGVSIIENASSSVNSGYGVDYNYMQSGSDYVYNDYVGTFYESGSNAFGITIDTEVYIDGMSKHKPSIFSRNDANINAPIVYFPTHDDWNNGTTEFQYSINVTGSVDVTGQFLVNGQPISGSGNIDTSSFATTGSNTFIGDQTIVGNVTFPSGSFISSNNVSGNLYFSALNGGILHLNDDGGEGDVIVGYVGSAGKLKVKTDTEITGSLNISSSAATDLTIQSRVNINGPSSGQTPRLIISASDGTANTIIGRQSAIFTGDGASITVQNLATSNYSSMSPNAIGIFANATDSAIEVDSNSATASFGVLSYDFATYDNELWIQADSNGVRMTDWDNANGSTSATPTIFFGANDGSQPAPILNRGLVTHKAIKGTGSINLQPDQTDARLIEIYNTAATDTHITASGGNLFLGNDETFVLVTTYANQKEVTIRGDLGIHISGSITSSNDISTSANIYAANLTGSGGNIDTGSFATTGSNTFIGDQIITGSVTTSADISVNSVTIGLGNGNISTNLAIGNGTLLANTTALGNIAIGAGALASQAFSGNGYNTAIGANTLSLLGSAGGAAAQLNNNVIIGSNTATAMTVGTRNTIVGASAMQNANYTERNTGLGRGVLTSLGTSAGSGSKYNTAIGHNTLFALTSGSNNTFIHGGTPSSGEGITEGSKNIVMGMDSGLPSTMESNTIIGRGIAGLTSPLSNNVILADGSGNIAFQKNSSSGVVRFPTGLEVTGSISIANGGSSNQLLLPSGSNQQTGLATLDGGNPGTVTVSNSLVTANSIIMLTKQTNTNTNAGPVVVSAKTNGSFTITTNHNGDTDIVAYMIINPS